METTIMISEVSFSRGYTSFWTEYAPWISDYVSSINKGLVERLEYPIEIGDDTIHRSINNTIAFTLFKNVIEEGNNDIEKALLEAKKIIVNYPRNNIETYVLSEEYKKIIQRQCERLLKHYRGKLIEFYPEFSGCGIMESCQGDMFYNETLVEIKAGERGVLSSDIKQIITYCALNWLSSNSKTIKRVEFYNPRQGILWESELEELIMTVSNLPIEDLFDQIGKYLINMSEDIELY
jgi:hypothetical protein